MHGRIKVRTSEEQAAAKRKEREKKMKLFSDLDQKINKKREKREFDEEALDLTEQILGVNPDVSTLWNFRREIFLKWREDGGFTEKLVNVSRKELAFLQGCLKVNPKSYGVWFHRQWVNEFIPAPDWTQELLLCNMFLSFDERNFHCWDYRRIVTKKANITAHEEFKFSTEKITENFSNYSSWHYRSKLLLLIHPDPSGNPERIEETALMNEFELAQNAFFTDPSDQSAWFYHRWLLGRDQPELDVDCLYTRRQCRHLTTIVQLSKPAKIIQLSPSLFINSVEVLTEWRNVFCTDQPCHLWISKCVIPYDSDEVSVTLQMKNEKLSRVHVLRQGEHESWTRKKHFNLLRSELTATHSALLESELDSCSLLMQEEPNNKWAMLTTVLLMRALDPLRYESEINEFLDKLTKVDPYRQEYYNDTRKKFRLENAMERYWKSDNKKQEFSLAGMGLTHLYHIHHLMTVSSVDLSRNKLRFLDDCNYLQCARRLDVSANHLAHLTRREFGLNLGLLQELTLTDNNISKLSALEALQGGCPGLRTLDLRGNPICHSDTYPKDVIALFPNLTKLDGQMLAGPKAYSAVC